MSTIEKVQAYWDRRPCNIRHSPLPVGSVAYWNEVEARKYFVEPHIPVFAEFARWRGKRVLEIGCGIGTDTINFARAGAIVTAIDLSSESLKLAKQRAAVFGVADRITFMQGNAESLPLFGEQFDLIYSFGVLHHTPNPQAAFDRIMANAKPGTVIKVMVYHKFSWKVAAMLLTHGYSRNFIAKQSEAESNCPVTYAYTVREAKALLTRAFTPHTVAIQDVRIDHIFPYSILAYKKYQYKKVGYFRILPSAAFRWLEQHVGWHLCITAEIQ